MCGIGRFGATSPVNGSTRSVTPNTNSRISPQRNSGIDSSRIETKSAAASNSVPRKWNSSSPPPTPKIAASTMAATASWIVAGSVLATSDPASRRSAIERPKSPCSAPAEPDHVLLAATADRGPFRGAWLRFPRSWRSAAATSRPDRPAAAAARRTTAPKRPAGSESPRAGGAQSAWRRLRSSGCHHPRRRAIQ